MTLEECVNEIARSNVTRSENYLTRPLVLTDLNKEKWIWEQDTQFVVPRQVGFHLEKLILPPGGFGVSVQISVSNYAKGFLTSWMSNEPIYCQPGSQIQFHILEPPNQNITLEVINTLKGGGAEWEFILAGSIIEPIGRTIRP